jgi:hypothetical protein
MLSNNEKITLAERIAREYPTQDVAEFLGVGVYSGKGLALALYPNNYDTIKNITNFDSPERRGKDIRLVVSIAKATTYINNAVKIYPLSFSKKDIESEAEKMKETQKSLKAQGIEYKTRNQGEIFEAWVIAEIGAQGNNKMNANKKDCGDCRVDGIEIQVKYNKSGLSIKE